MTVVLMHIHRTVFSWQTELLYWQWCCHIDSDSNVSAVAWPLQHLASETAKLCGP